MIQRPRTQTDHSRPVEKNTLVATATVVLLGTFHLSPASGQVPDTDRPPAVAAAPPADSRNTGPQIESVAQNTGQSRHQDETGRAIAPQPTPTDAETRLTSAQVRTLFQEMRRKELENWATTVTWWLAAVAIFLTLIAIAVAISGLIAFRRFDAIKVEVRDNKRKVQRLLEETKSLVKTARRLVSEIRDNRDYSVELTDEQADNVRIIQAKLDGSDLGTSFAKPVDNALALQREGRTDKAIELWRSIANVAERSDADLASRAWFSVGYLLDIGREEERIDAYSAAIRLRSTFARAYNNRAVAKRRLRRYKEAMADYDEAIRLKPKFVGAYNNRGSLKRRIGLHEEAMADYNTAIDLDSGYAKAYNNRGNLLRRLARCEEAMADFDDAIRMSPTYATAYFNRGNLKTRLGRYEEAIADYDAALRVKPDFSGARRCKRVALRRQSQGAAVDGRA